MKGADSKPVKAKFGLKNKVVTVYHGAITEERGIFELIEAAKKLIKKHDNLKFLIIGRNYEPFSDLVKKMKLDDVFVFTGPVPYSDIPSYLSASDVSYSVFRPIKLFTITIATKVYEAMLAGLPVIANAEFPAQNELMSKHRFGLLVKCDIDEITTGLEKLINDSSLRAKLGRKGIELAKNEYNWEAQERKLFELYKTLLEK
jgi:glycosyltransferase involved in cell wall biosynthesis